MRAPPVLAGLLTCLGIVILVTLGMWQLQRLEWKNSLEAELEQAYAESRRLPVIKPIDFKREQFTFKRGVIQGRYIPGKNIMIGPKTHDGKIGKHFYAPFEMDEGFIVWVNRGWVPQNFSLLVEDQHNMAPIALTGIFKKPPRKNKFTPQNIPEKNEWYHPDLVEMSAHKDVYAINGYVFLLEDDGSKAEYPIKSATKIEYRNNHLGYAIFWFLTAATLAVIFFLRFMKK